MTQSPLIKKIFNNHHEYYKQTGIETIKQQAGQVEQVSSDYEGRVVYELLQNAFDKADRHILVKVEGNSLYIANDGTKFNFTADYNYQTGGTDRGDFQSLCSISTSTKKAGVNIGNKGVGFKSAFSIAKDGYVNVYTQGEIISEYNTINEVVNFRIYDSFKDTDKITIHLEPEINELLQKQIPEIQKEHPKRGVPGYYYPQHIKKESPFIEALFKEGYVTIIEIPFSDNDAIIRLLDNVKQVHFDFISLKYQRNFKLKFEFNDQQMHKEVCLHSKNLFWAVLDGENIKKLSADAGIELENPKVAFSIRQDNNGYLYNYLPTAIKSPFPYIDFHADFHTTVDRKGINFDLKIGAYNNALLAACLELYWSVLNSSLEDNCRVKLKLDYIPQEKYEFQDFNWNLIECTNTLNCSFYNMTILQIREHQFKTASMLLAMLAKNYFKKDKPNTEYDAFYRNVQVLIHNNATKSAQYNGPIKAFKYTLAKLLLDHSVPLMPGLDFSRRNEIIYKKPDDKNLILPKFLGIVLTDYQVDKIHGSDFKKALGIKDFNDYNEILKYFKQCSFSGDHSNDYLTESQQKLLIKSLFELFSAREDKTIESTHRFTKVFTTELRKNNSALNRANFNISTIFIKTKVGKFKPAQICTLDELDPEFLSSINCEHSKMESFLTFLGVSIDKEVIFADERIYNRLKNGVDLPPGLMSRQADQNDEINDLLIKHMKIISKGEQTHPALVNDNGYKFLYRFYNKKINANLENLLVKKYSEFPKEYRNILKETLENNLYCNKEDVIRLYQSLFHMYSKDDQYLILENGVLQWTTEKTFIIVNSKRDFELIIQLKGLQVLCYYIGQNLPKELEGKTAKKNKGLIKFDKIEEYEELKIKLEERMVYLLVRISYSKNTELNYLENYHNITELRRRIQAVKFFKADNLEQLVTFNNFSVVSPTAYAYNENVDTSLYFSSTSSHSSQALGIAEYFFSNPALKDIIDLTIFHKTQDDLKNEYDLKDLQILNSKWKKDYDVKFEHFQTELADLFQINTEGLWYIYNETNRSEALIKLDNENRLEEIQLYIESLKNDQAYLNYFDEFKVEINYEHIEKMAAELLLLIESHEENNELVAQIQLLSKKIGIEDQLLNIKNDLLAKYPLYSVPTDKEKLDIKVKNLELDRKIEKIYKTIGNQQNNLVCHTPLSGGITSTIPINTIKTIYQGTSTGGTVEEQELTGANGEEQVLNYFIKEFLKHNAKDREIGINETYKVLKIELGNDKHMKFRNDCLRVLNNDSELTRALIPFFYIALHHKYAYVDLIVYKNKVPTLIEVKSTKGNHNNFLISSSEVNTARRSNNYELVRVTKNKMIFIGNPIRSIDDHIKQIKGENFTLTPRNFEFNIK